MDNNLARIFLDNQQRKAWVITRRNLAVIVTVLGLAAAGWRPADMAAALGISRGRVSQVLGEYALASGLLELDYGLFHRQGRVVWECCYQQCRGYSLRPLTSGCAGHHAVVRVVRNSETTAVIDWLPDGGVIAYEWPMEWNMLDVYYRRQGGFEAARGALCLLLDLVPEYWGGVRLNTPGGDDVEDAALQEFIRRLNKDYRPVLRKPEQRRVGRPARHPDVAGREWVKDYLINPKPFYRCKLPEPEPEPAKGGRRGRRRGG